MLHLRQHDLIVIFPSLKFYWPVYVVTYVNVSFTVLIVVKMFFSQFNRTFPARLLNLLVQVITSPNLLPVEFSHVTQIQRFLPRGHGSVMCQTKCFLRSGVCAHRVRITCESDFTACEKAFYCNLKGGGANSTK